MLGICYTCVALWRSAHGCCAMECSIACCAAQHTAIATLTVRAIRTMGIKAMVMVRVMGRPMIGSMLLLPKNGRGAWLTYLRGIRHSYLVIFWTLGWQALTNNLSLGTAPCVVLYNTVLWGVYAYHSCPQPRFLTWILFYMQVLHLPWNLSMNFRLYQSAHIVPNLKTWLIVVWHITLYARYN